MLKSEYDLSKIFTPAELGEINRRAIVEAKFIRGEYSSIGQMALEAYGPSAVSKDPATIAKSNEQLHVIADTGPQEVN